VAHASTLSRDVRTDVADVSKVDAAKKVGQTIAKLLLAKGIDRVVFDRSGYLYHGRIRALADAARTAGLKF
jgi:large subunit ribosomal protein L18